MATKVIEIEIYDCNPAFSSGGKLCSEEIELGARASEQKAVVTAMKAYARTLDRSMGYEPGDLLYAIWDNESGVQEQVSYTLTARDLR